MELLTWFWAFDKRLFCCLRYGRRTFPLIWLIPTLIAFVTLILTWVFKFTSDHNYKDCAKLTSDYGNVKRGAVYLRKMMLV